MPIKFGWEGKPSRSHKQLNPSLLEGWLYCLDSLTWIKIYYQNIKWLLFLRKKNIKWLFIVKTICLKKSLFDTIKEQINKKIEELLQLYYNNSFVLLLSRSIQDIATHLNQDSESLEQLLTILKNLTELGIYSQEFQQILLFLSQWIYHLNFKNKKFYFKIKL